MAVTLHKHIKQFKSDSARLAFLVWVKFSVYGGQIEYRGCVLHTLIGRYVFVELPVYKVDVNEKYRIRRRYQQSI